MINTGLDLLVVFVLAAFLGYEVISKVPSILHTPLMSGSNAIHGIILVGTMIIADEAHGILQILVSLVAVILATLNIVGGGGQFTGVFLTGGPNNGVNPLNVTWTETLRLEITNLQGAAAASGNFTFALGNTTTH